ncbi:hypothetical protein GCM10023318_11010 [Nocardia callitridis]|uniref:Uncharacterized protein n=1 Tax=Nocardia callitridis TaxID=648753 RepID=A0ABP9JXY9_9NOCA
MEPAHQTRTHSSMPHPTQWPYMLWFGTECTWTTGASAQGAAKQAGAASVTILCVARWLRWDWDDHKRLIDALEGGFDALRCPVHGRPCESAAEFVLPDSQG